MADTLATEIGAYWSRARDAALSAGLPADEYRPITHAIYLLQINASVMADYADVFNGCGDIYLSAAGLTDGWHDMAATLCVQVETMAEKHAESRTPEARAWAAGEERAALAREGV